MDAILRTVRKRLSDDSRCLPPKTTGTYMRMLMEVELINIKQTAKRSGESNERYQQNTENFMWHQSFVQILERTGA